MTSKLEGPPTAAKAMYETVALIALIAMVVLVFAAFVVKPQLFFLGIACGVVWAICSRKADRS